MKSRLQLLVASLAVAGLGPGGTTATGETTVSAAASLREAMTAAAAAFETAPGGERVVLNFGASGALAQQIRNGAPVDLFVSADPQWMDSLAADGLIAPDSIRTVFANSLVLIAPAQRPEIAGWSDLVSRHVRRLALGETRSVPAGRYARATLESLGIWEAVSDRLVFAKDVRQVIAYVADGSADAGIVYRTDALVFPSVRIVASAPAGSHPPIVYPMGVTGRSVEPARAAAFLEFLAGDSGKACFLERGFVLARPEP